MIEIIGVILVCILINTVELISVIFLGVGIGILGAVDFISQHKISINKAGLLALQISSTLFISLSLLNEVPVYYVFFIAFGMCMFYTLYNLKKANKISTILLLVVACITIDIAFFHVLNILRFLVFTICIIGYLCLIYLKKPCSNKESILEKV